VSRVAAAADGEVVLTDRGLETTLFFALAARALHAPTPTTRKETARDDASDTVPGRRPGDGARLAGADRRGAGGFLAAAQDRWRAVNAPHLVALVRAGALFVNGKLGAPPR
jgi:hypothetical protein